MQVLDWEWVARLRGGFDWVCFSGLVDSCELLVVRGKTRRNRTRFEKWEVLGKSEKGGDGADGRWRRAGWARAAGLRKARCWKAIFPPKVTVRRELPRRAYRHARRRDVSGKIGAEGRRRRSGRSAKSRGGVGAEVGGLGGSSRTLPGYLPDCAASVYYHPTERRRRGCGLWRMGLAACAKTFAGAALGRATAASGADWLDAAAALWPRNDWLIR